MIIISEPSAKATQLVRTCRSTLARRRASAARGDALRYADAQPISVHTEVLPQGPVSPEVFSLIWENRASPGGRSPG